MNNLTDNLPENALKGLSNRLGSVFSNGKFSFGAFGLNLTLNSQDKGHSNAYFSDQIISSLSGLIKEVIIEQKEFDGLLIIIDEIDNIEDIEAAALMFKGIINTLDFKERGYVSFLLIGYSAIVDKFFKGDQSARRSFI